MILLHLVRALLTLRIELGAENSALRQQPTVPKTIAPRQRAGVRDYLLSTVHPGGLQHSHRGAA